MADSTSVDKAKADLARATEEEKTTSAELTTAQNTYNDLNAKKAAAQQAYQKCYQTDGRVPIW